MSSATRNWPHVRINGQSLQKAAAPRNRQIQPTDRKAKQQKSIPNCNEMDFFEFFAIVVVDALLRLVTVAFVFIFEPQCLSVRVVRCNWWHCCCCLGCQCICMYVADSRSWDFQKILECSTMYAQYKEDHKEKSKRKWSEEGKTRFLDNSKKRVWTLRKKFMS